MNHRIQRLLQIDWVQRGWKELKFLLPSTCMSLCCLLQCSHAFVLLARNMTFFVSEQNCVCKIKNVCEIGLGFKYEQSDELALDAVRFLLWFLVFCSCYGPLEWRHQSRINFTKWICNLLLIFSWLNHCKQWKTLLKIEVRVLQEHYTCQFPNLSE